MCIHLQPILPASQAFSNDDRAGINFLVAEGALNAKKDIDDRHQPIVV
jgi:hypothetical protein|tara:strand:+ start:1521 stop:1664 length:144 start_codon:yes stop_codon:yes gene_type:complete